MGAAKRSRLLTVDRGRRRRELVAALRELASVEGPNVTMRRFARHLGRSQPYVTAYFESWDHLREAAGLPRKRRVGYSRETLLEVLKKAESESDRPVSRRRFHHLTGVSPSTCDRVFGSWREFREAAGLMELAAPGVPPRYTRDGLLRMMREQVPVLGRGMTRNQFADAVGVSTATIQRLGSWARSGKSWA